MRPELQETRIQGTPMHPLKIYDMFSIGGKIDVPCHWQETTEILLMQKGQLSLRIGDISYNGIPGDIFYINPRELHGMQSLTADCAYSAFLFPVSWLQSAQVDEAQERYLKPLSAQQSYVAAHFPPQTSSAVSSVLQEIIALYQNLAPGSWLGIKGCLLYFYYLIHRDGLVRRRQEDAEQTQTLLEISLYIHERCAYPLSLQLLGQKFHMSPKYFSSYFQKHFMRNFSDYLTAVRVENAEKLLRETDAGMELIAQKSGFSSSSYFVRVFREAVGITPGQYRKAVGSAHTLQTR